VSSGLRVPKKPSEFVQQVGAMIALVRANRVPLADSIIEGPVKRTRLRHHEATVRKRGNRSSMQSRATN
jgi:hypothetical protein